MTNKSETMMALIAERPQTPEEWEKACNYLNECEKEVTKMATQFEQTKQIWEVSTFYYFINNKKSI